MLRKLLRRQREEDGDTSASITSTPVSDGSGKPGSATPVKLTFDVNIGDSIQPHLELHDAVLTEIMHNEDILNLVNKCRELGVDAQLPIDKLFVLRFLLSSRGNVAKTLESLRKALNWRIDNYELLTTVDLNLKSSSGKLVAGQPGSKMRKELEIVEDHLCGGYLGLIPGNSCPVLAARLKYYRLKDLMRGGEKGAMKVDKEAILMFVYMSSELSYRVCDIETRRTGRMVKKIEILDCDNFSPFSKQFDSTFMKHVGETSKVSEWLFPQLLGKRCIVNAPGALLAFLKIARNFMSKKSMEKIGVCTGGKTYKSGKNLDDCPFVKRLGIGSILPPFLGGNGPLPDTLNPDMKSTVNHTDVAEEAHEHFSSEDLKKLQHDGEDKDSTDSDMLD